MGCFVTLKFDGWLRKATGHHSYPTSSFVHHFIAMGELKFDLVWKRPIRAKIGNFLFHVTLKFDGWPWKKGTKLFYANSSFVHCFLTICVFKLGTRSIRVKIVYFLARVILKFDEWLRKTIGHLFYATASVVHHFVAICEFKLELQSGNAQIWAIFVLTSVTLTSIFCMDIFLSMVIKFHNDTMTGTWWKSMTNR